MMTVNDMKLKIEDKESQRVDPMAAYISNFEECASTFKPQTNLVQTEEPLDITKTASYMFGQMLVQKTNEHFVKSTINKGI